MYPWNHKINVQTILHCISIVFIRIDFNVEIVKKMKWWCDPIHLIRCDIANGWNVDLWHDINHRIRKYYFTLKSFPWHGSNSLERYSCQTLIEKKVNLFWGKNKNSVEIWIYIDSCTFNTGLCMFQGRK